MNAAQRAEAIRLHWLLWGCGQAVSYDTQLHTATLLTALLEAPAPAAQEAGGCNSRAMFVARLEKMQENGDSWLTIAAVVMLLHDCDKLAALADAPAAQEPAAPLKILQTQAARIAELKAALEGMTSCFAPNAWGSECNRADALADALAALGEKP